MRTYSKACLGIGLFTLLALTGCMRQPAPAPVPAGEVEIYVDYDNFSSEQYNQLFKFLRALSEPYAGSIKGSDSIRDTGDSSGFHGFFNDGHITLRYRPNHPVPNPEVEADMRKKLDAWLKENDHRADAAILNLRYGDEEPDTPPANP